MNRSMRSQELFMGTAELRARVLSAQLPLPAHTLHVWRTALSAITPLADEMKMLLSADEQARADKFRFAGHRSAFIAGRAFCARFWATIAAAHQKSCASPMAISTSPGSMMWKAISRGRFHSICRIQRMTCRSRSRRKERWGSMSKIRDGNSTSTVWWRNA